jgi:transposase
VVYSHSPQPEARDEESSLRADPRKEGGRYLRTPMVQGAQHIVGPFGQDSDLRRWGLKLSERGDRNGKKRAEVAVTRKLSVLLHELWLSGEVYEPLRNHNVVASAVA